MTFSCQRTPSQRARPASARREPAFDERGVATPLTLLLPSLATTIFGAGTRIQTGADGLEDRRAFNYTMPAHLARAAGIEPADFGFGDRADAVTSPLYHAIWVERRDSNSSTAGSQPTPHPLRIAQHKSLKRRNGFTCRPALHVPRGIPASMSGAGPRAQTETLPFTGRLHCLSCSTSVTGAAGRNRTADFTLTKGAVYLLTYHSMARRPGVEPGICSVTSAVLYQLRHLRSSEMAVATGVEPAISCVTSKRELHLLYATEVPRSGFEPLTIQL